MVERMSVRELRDQLGRRIDIAHFTGEPTIVERHGEPRAVLVPYAWWAEQHN
jgi:prevent-host-death family protein